VRWGLAVAAVYYYNTSSVFAEHPQNNLLNPNLEAYEDATDATTVEALTSQRARQAEKNSSVLKSAAETVSSENASTSVAAAEDATGSAGELEEEAASEGAFNPETGEINWDCPCLGGMAYGPCGPEFREAFSCFVFSTEEPKGMDCIDKFQNMQQCFQKYPEVYKGELEDDEELDAGLEAERQELVNEIAERKAQMQESAPQHRLLEEPASAPAPPKSSRPKKSASTEQNAAAPQEGQAESGKKSSQARPAHLESNKSPQEEGKVQVHGDERMSVERETIYEGQKSATTSNPQTKPVDETAIPEADVIPRAAHDARGSSGVLKHDTEK